ncbi:hypothetical protein BBJ28_00025859 [Nothophytophthora sp. Chile5]|nr:hypothetical protein BBJ28_00025859 [Nothophytophthora sp. Chile5]
MTLTFTTEKEPGVGWTDGESCVHPDLSAYCRDKDGCDAPGGISGVLSSFLCIHYSDVAISDIREYKERAELPRSAEAHELICAKSVLAIAKMQSKPAQTIKRLWRIWTMHNSSKRRGRHCLNLKPKGSS